MFNEVASMVKAESTEFRFQGCIYLSFILFQDFKLTVGILKFGTPYICPHMTLNKKKLIKIYHNYYIKLQRNMTKTLSNTKGHKKEFNPIHKAIKVAF